MYSMYSQVRNNLRIIILAPPIDIPPADGTAKRIVELSQRLVEHGCDVTVLAKLESKKEHKNKYSFMLMFFLLDRPSDKLLYLFYAIRWHLLMFSLCFKMLLIKKPQIVICETFTPAIPAILLSKIAKIPLVLDVHSINSKRFSDRGESAFKVLLFRIIEKISALCADIIIVASVELLTMFRSDTKYKEKVSYIPTGVDMSKFSSNINGGRIKKIFGECPIVLFLGPPAMYTNRMAILNLYDVAKVVLDKNPYVKFVIVGKGRPLKPIPRNVIYTGFVDKVEEYIAAADITIIPYKERTQEGIPVKALEYMAMGKPIVSTPEGIKNVPGLIDGKNCIVAQTPLDMAEAILYLLENRDRAKELGTNALRVAQQYDWKQLSREFLRIIKECL